MVSDLRPVRITSLDGVVRLAAEITAVDRSHPVICITTPHWSSEPLVDPDALQGAVGAEAHVYLLPTGELTYELSDRLPPRLDVYGGAVRVWWPLEDGEPDPYDHPLLFLYDRSEAEETIERIVEAFESRGLLERERLEAGTDTMAVVEHVSTRGAELKLTNGTPAFASASHLTRLNDLPPDEVVRPGQAVRVRVGEASHGSRRVPVSLLPFEPDPWKRLVEQYAEGMLVEGIVAELRNVGAFGEISPGFRALLPKGQISREWVSHPEDFLEGSERITVRILSIDHVEQRAAVSWLDIAPDAVPERPASLYPDGPPWLPELPEEVEPEPETPVEEPKPEPLVAAPTPPEERETEEEPEEAPEPMATSEEASLQATVEAGRELETQVASMFSEAERRLARSSR
jgi:S1 RNA binding domain